MVRSHDWQDCQPVLLTTWAEQTPAEHTEALAAQAALDQVWSTLAAHERRAFHDFCCNNARDLHATGVVAKIQTLVKAAMKVN
jgi:hypothetical protein